MVKHEEAIQIDLGFVVYAAKRIESILVKELHASGRGLHEKISSVTASLPFNLIVRLRKVASLRNKLVHDDTFQPSITMKCLKEIFADAESDLLNVVASKVNGNPVEATTPHIPLPAGSVSVKVLPRASAKNKINKIEKASSTVQSEALILPKKVYEIQGSKATVPCPYCERPTTISINRNSSKCTNCNQSIIGIVYNPIFNNRLVKYVPEGHAGRLFLYLPLFGSS